MRCESSGRLNGRLTRGTGKVGSKGRHGIAGQLFDQPVRLDNDFGRPGIEPINQSTQLGVTSGENGRSARPQKARYFDFSAPGRRAARCHLRW
jgi:hypothetical protein